MKCMQERQSHKQVSEDDKKGLLRKMAAHREETMALQVPVVHGPRPRISRS